MYNYFSIDSNNSKFEVSPLTLLILQRNLPILFRARAGYFQIIP